LGCDIRSEWRLVWTFLSRPRKRKPEIDYLGHAIDGDHDVGGLDVAVDNAVIVGLGQTLSNLDRDVNRFLDLQRAALNLILERLAFVAVHDNKELAVR
jgi:hypothetical protein